MGWHTNQWRALSRSSLTVWDILAVSVAALNAGYEGTVWTSSHGFARGALDVIGAFVFGREPSFKGMPKQVRIDRDVHVIAGDEPLMAHIAGTLTKDIGAGTWLAPEYSFTGTYNGQAASGYIIVMRGLYIFWGIIANVPWPELPPAARPPGGS